MAISKKKKEKLQRSAHILAGFLILVHAWDRYTLHQSSYLIFAVLGIIFITIALLHHKLAAFSHFVDSAFMIIESICVAIIAVDYYTEGRKGLPWCYAFASVMYVIAAVFAYRRKKAQTRKLSLKQPAHNTKIKQHKTSNPNNGSY